MMAYLVHLVGNLPQAEDLAAEVWLRVAAKNQLPDNWRVYLRAHARYAVLNSATRNRAQRANRTLSWGDELAVSTQPDPFAVCAARELAARVGTICTTMPEPPEAPRGRPNKLRLREYLHDVACIEAVL
jgi:DNA-directed RNA polymerase specialized sigma24 family protein